MTQATAAKNVGITDAAEVEGLRVLEKRECEADMQEMNIFGAGLWSGDAQLFGKAPVAGAEVTVALPVKAEGTYRIGIAFTQAPDYGIVQVRLDGKDGGQGIRWICHEGDSFGAGCLW